MSIWNAQLSARYKALCHHTNAFLARKYYHLPAHLPPCNDELRIRTEENTKGGSYNKTFLGTEAKEQYILNQDKVILK